MLFQKQLNVIFFPKYVRFNHKFAFSPHQNIQPVDSEYKEGREFVLSEFIKEGSYGEVHSAQDVNTGFKFAVKKVTPSEFIA